MVPQQRQFSIRYGIVAMVGLLLIEVYLYAPRPETLAYSDFIKLVKAGKVSDVTLAPDVDLGALAARTSGFVGAGLERRSRLINPREKAIVAHHEAGHAIVAELRPGADPVRRISIIPRGVVALGYTEQQPTEDRYLLTRAELLDRLDVLLGGRVAEEIMFDDVSTGAADDLRRATDIVRHMVAQYSMSAKRGLATFEEPRQTFLAPVAARWRCSPSCSWTKNAEP
jgi:cell division protease FtsH